MSVIRKLKPTSSYSSSFTLVDECRSAADTLIPCSRSLRSRAAHSVSDVVSMPPSPVVSSFRGWNDQAASEAPALTGRPLYVDPAAHAESCTRAMFRLSHNACTASTSNGMPPWWTPMTATVRGVTTASIVSGVTFPVAGPTSANTGVALTYRTALAVAMNENDGTTTSSPAFTPSRYSARCRPVVHDDTATPWPAPLASANASSNSATRGPCATQPDRTTA